MNAIGLQIQPWMASKTGSASEKARRDVMVVCPDQASREAYAELFARRGLKVGQVANCRTAITSQEASGIRLAVVVALREDPYTGALIHSLSERQPQPCIWLIGNSAALRLTEIIAKHEVALLPESTTPEGLEHTLFALDAAKPNPNGMSVTRMLAQRPAGQGKYVEDFHRAKWEFERRFILRVLQCYHGNVCPIARISGTREQSLRLRIHALEHDIEGTRG